MRLFQLSFNSHFRFL